MINIAILWLIFGATVLSYEMFALGLFMANMSSDIAVATGFAIAVFGPALVIISAASCIAKIVNKKGNKE